MDTEVGWMETNACEEQGCCDGVQHKGGMPNSDLHLSQRPMSSSRKTSIAT